MTCMQTLLPDLPEAVIANMLEAMVMQSGPARDRFPRLIDLLGQFPSAEKLFLERTSRVPCWMFLRWLSQIMVLFAFYTCRHHRRKQ